MYTPNTLYDGTTHVVISFTEHSNLSEQIQVKLVPLNWVFFENGKWWTLYPAAEEYDNLETLCKSSAPPKRNWKSYEIEILSECSNYGEGLTKLNRSFTRENIDESTTGGETEIEKNKKKLKQNTNHNVLDDIPAYPKKRCSKSSKENPDLRVLKEKCLEIVDSSEEENEYGSQSLPQNKILRPEVLQHSSDSEEDFIAICETIFSSMSGSSAQTLTEIASLSGQGEKIGPQPSTSAMTKGLQMKGQERLGFKTAMKNFNDSLDEARKAGVDSTVVDVMEKGFLMIVAKMDWLRESLQYDIKKEFKKISSSRCACGVNPTSLDEMKRKLNVPLPISDFDVFEVFDADLDMPDRMTDCINLIKSLSFGAKHEMYAIDSILQLFMAKQLQKQFSGRGRKVKGQGKKDFSATKLCSLTLGVLMPQFGTSKDSLLSKIGRWLAGANDREGGRKERVHQEFITFLE